jgi:hypothetical protein
MARIQVGGFDYAKAFSEWTFVQVPPLSLGAFESAAAERGLSLHGATLESWETLDCEELLPPIAYGLAPSWHHDTETLRSDGALIVRDESGYIEWHELERRARERGASLHPLYSHWQLLTLAALKRALSLADPWAALAEGLNAFEAARAAFAARPLPREELLELAQTHRREELLLARTQNFFMPRVRGGRYRAGRIVGLTEDAADWVDELEQGFDFAAAAAESGVSADDLAHRYRELLARGDRIDPLRAWFDLADQTKRDQRERLRGPARLALDHYDAARVLRGWHSRISDDPLPDINELHGRAVMERMYGVGDIRGNREALPGLLEHFGLYPWRVQLICEGPGEVAILEAILEAWGFSFGRLGIHSVVVGTANIPANAELLLAAVRPYANYYFLLFDNEGRARELIDELQRGGVIEGVSDEQRRRALRQALQEARGETYASENDRRAHLAAARDRAHTLESEPGQAPEFFVWTENIEADNFGLEELVAVVENEAATAGLEGFALDVEAIRTELEAERSRAAPRGVARIILEAAEAAEPPFLLEKVAFDRALGRFAVRHPERDGEQRKILALAEHLIQLTVADRRLAGDLRER